MSARHAFAFVFATALLAILAALLHPLLGLTPLHGLEKQTGGGKVGAAEQGTAAMTRSR